MATQPHNPLMLPEGFTTPFEGLAEALDGAPEVSVRVNRAKGGEVPDGAERVPWCADGYYLSERPAFTLDPAMHQGLYYVQDASSMIYSRIVGELTAGRGPVAYLDACAAPGGKTTAAIAALPAGSIVVANEYVYLRAEVLKENLIKWGYPHIAVTRGDVAALGALGPVFDIVAADVPCSGEGMFRKEPEAVERWSPALVAECAALQHDIVTALWPSLKPGGYLIYSTCTFNRAENEEQVARLCRELGAETVDLKFPPEWGTVATDGCVHFLPGRVRGEGLTVALLHKPGDMAFKGLPPSTPSGRRKAAKGQKGAAPPCPDLSGWLADPGEFNIVRRNDGSIAALPRSPLIDAVASRCDMIYAGVLLAEPKGRDYIPSQALAMSTALSPTAFPRWEVSPDTARDYLRRQALTLPASAPRGLVMLTCGGSPLGFVKNLGQRANNLYPQQWKIRHV